MNDDEDESFLDFDWNKDFCEDVYEDEEISEEEKIESGRDFYKYDLEQMREIINLADNGWSFATIQHRFMKLRYPHDISR